MLSQNTLCNGMSQIMTMSWKRILRVCDLKTVAQLRLTCKMIENIATPKLFRKITRETPNPIAIICGRLSLHVLEAHCDSKCSVVGVSALEYCTMLLKRCPNIRILHLSYESDLECIISSLSAWEFLFKLCIENAARNQIINRIDCKCFSRITELEFCSAPLHSNWTDLAKFFPNLRCLFLGDGFAHHFDLSNLKNLEYFTSLGAQLRLQEDLNNLADGSPKLKTIVLGCPDPSNVQFLSLVKSRKLFLIAQKNILLLHNIRNINSNKIEYLSLTLGREEDLNADLFCEFIRNCISLKRIDIDFGTNRVNLGITPCIRRFLNQRNLNNQEIFSMNIGIENIYPMRPSLWRYQ